MLERFLPGAAERRAISYQAIWGAGGEVSTRTWSGNSVDAHNALTLSTVYACVRLVTDSVSTLPADTFFRADGERLPYRPRPAWVTEPDVGVTWQDHMQQVMVSLLIDGNAYVRVYRNSIGEPVALVVLDPMKVEPRRNGAGDVEYVYDQRTVIPGGDVLHLVELRRPGKLKGVSRISELKQTLGLSSALDEFAARFFSNGANVSGVIELDASVTREQAMQIKASFEETNRGPRNSHRVGVLGGGSRFKETTVNPEDSQLLESRRFAVEEVARVFGVPLHLLQYSGTHQSYASNEQNAIQFQQYTVRSYVHKVEVAYSRLLPREAFLRLNMDALVRPDLATRFAAYSTGIQAGFLSINDIHRLEDMRPVEGGDVYRVPLANVNLAAADLVETDKRVLMAQRLVVAGFEPSAALAAVGLPAIAHTGLPSVQLQGIAQVDPQDPAAAYPVRSQDIDEENR